MKTPNRNRYAEEIVEILKTIYTAVEGEPLEYEYDEGDDSYEIDYKNAGGLTMSIGPFGLGMEEDEVAITIHENRIMCYMYASLNFGPERSDPWQVAVMVDQIARITGAMREVPYKQYEFLQAKMELEAYQARNQKLDVEAAA